MRNYSDRGSERRSRWDEDVNFIVPDNRNRRFRLVGPVQDIANHWCVQGAGDYADKLGSMREKAIAEGREFKPPKAPPGVPFLCPKFDLFREKVVDWKNPKTGQGWYDSEVVKAVALERQGIEVPRGTDRNKDRFCPRAMENGKAVRLDRLCCPMCDDFKSRPNQRTWWFCFERNVKTIRGRDVVKGNSDFGVLGKSGMPYTPMKAIDKIAKFERVDPADPKQGFDITMSLDKTARRADDMYSVQKCNDAPNHPLTSDEIKEVFGRYILKNGKKTNIMGIFKLRRENPKALVGMKVIEEAGLLPLEEMAAADVDPDNMRRFMERSGYYDDDGRPRRELYEGKDENDNAWKDTGSEDDEEEEEAPRRRRRSKKTGSKSARGKTRTRTRKSRPPADGEDEAPPPRKRRRKRPPTKSDSEEAPRKRRRKRRPME